MHKFRYPGIAFAIAALAVALDAAQPPSTIAPSGRFDWGGNIGWVDWLAGGTESGAVFANQHFAAGSIWSPNIGWISLGTGAPAVGSSYSNASGADYGVNIDAASDPAFDLLSGLAWSANCGWISFNVADPASRPKIEKATGILRGYAWGANIGWITLDAPGVEVRTGLFARSAAGGDWTMYP